jgi:hypothetical protein
MIRAAIRSGPVAAPVVLFLLLLVPGPLRGEETADEIMKSVLGSFSLPLGDLLQKEHPEEWRNLFHGLSGNIAYNFPLRRRKPTDREGGDAGGDEGRNRRGAATFRYNPLSYWFLQTTFYLYANDDLKAPWDPDFSYVFGYDDWRPWTLSLVYSNYGGNRLDPDRSAGERYTRFEEGVIRAGLKFTLPRWMEEWFIVHPEGGVRGSANYLLTPRYFDAAAGETRKWKQRMSLNVKYTIYKWIHFTWALYWYPDRSQRQPWDPDFTYEFGLFDWRPGTLSLQYNNFSGNRLFGGSGDGGGSFLDGSVSASWSWAF